MNFFHNILAVIEYKQVRQPALERALALYQYAKAHKKNADIKITAVLPVAQENWNITSILAVDKEEYEKSYREKLSKWLNAYLAINAMGVNIERKVLFSKEVGKEIVSLAKDLCADILIKTADIHGVLDNVISTPLDWQMLRHAPIPVYIAKDQIFTPKGKIAVAIDLSEPDDELSRLTNLRLLREAQYLSTFTGCKIVMINAVPPIIPPIAVDMPGFTPDSLYDESLKDSCHKALEFANRHKIKPEDCFIAEGAIDEVILSKCEEIKPTALFIGTSARRGIASAILGNICERVADSIDCDVFVVTPKAVVRAVPTTTPSKSF